MGKSRGSYREAGVLYPPSWVCYFGICPGWSGKKENCLKADQQVSFASEEKQLRDLVATDATPEIEVQLEEILFLKLVEMPLKKAEKGMTRMNWLRC